MKCDPQTPSTSSSMPVLQASLSGVFAACVATGATVAIERLGGLVGGVLSTSPTTIVPASIGIALAVSGGGSPDADGIARAMFAVPLGMLCDALFLSVWKLLPRALPVRIRGHVRFGLLLAASLAVWAVTATAAWWLTTQALRELSAVMIVGFMAYVAIGVLGVALTWRPEPAPKGHNRVSWRMLVARGLFAGIAISVAVTVSELSPSLAGLVSTFPAIFLTTMAALYLAQGEDMMLGATGPMILGSISVPTYAIAYAFLAPPLGAYGAAPLAWILAISLSSTPIGCYLRRRQQAFATRLAREMGTRPGETALDQVIEDPSSLATTAVEMSATLSQNHPPMRDEGALLEQEAMPDMAPLTTDDPAR